MDINVKDIVIPAIPDPTTKKPEKLLMPDPLLQWQGSWYTLSPAHISEHQEAVEQVAKQLIYYEIRKLTALRDTLLRKQIELQDYETRLRTSIELPVPDAAVAATGLRIWKESPGVYAVEKPLVYFPQRVVQKTGAEYSILPGQFTPRYVMGFASWNVATHELHHMHLFHLREHKQFDHYHMWEMGSHDTDCIGALPRRAADYQELLSIFSLWEQQLQVVNISSLAKEEPMGLPNINAIKVDDKDLHDVGVWTTERKAS